MDPTFDQIAFWKAAPGEDEEDCRLRFVDALLEDEEPPALSALNGFLKHPDPQVRVTAARAWARVGIDLLDLDETGPLILPLLDDPSTEVRAEAIRCCHQGHFRDAVPALLRILREDEVVRRELRANDPSRRSRLTREIVRALEAFEVSMAVPLLSELGVRLRWLSRRSSGLPAFVGRYVPAAEGQTPLLPAQDLGKNPPCPECAQPLRIIAVVEEPLGPVGAGKVPFYRCLSCTWHYAIIVSLGPPASCLGMPWADLGEYGIRGPDPGQLPWSLAWTPRTPAHEIEVYTPLLGGEPNWVQYEETPVCPVCEEKMDFVIKLPGTEKEFPLVEFEGVVYGFWCGRCRVTATNFQVS